MPQMQFSTLVLPAPLGPMSASSSPVSSANEMPSSTCRPPKARRTSRSSSSAIPPPAATVLLDVTIAAPRTGAAEIELGDVRVRAQPLRRAVEDHAAVLHHVAIIGDLQRHARVLLHEEDRHAKLPADCLQALHQ